MANHEEQLETMSIGGHLEVLRQMVLRILLVVAVLAAVIFCFKEETFRLLLAPKESDFVTFRVIEHLSAWIAGWTGGEGFHFDPYQIQLISTELSAQFMMHLSASFALAGLLASPYILYELLGYITPALYANERRYTLTLGISCYLLFAVGVLMTYFILAPISFRFLGTYQVDASVQNTITLDSYISTFTSLTFAMGLVFQLPVLSWILAKMGWLKAYYMKHFRRHALVLIMVIAAIITPPDVFTLFLVTGPLYLLYEGCILIVSRFDTIKK